MSQAFFTGELGELSNREQDGNKSNLRDLRNESVRSVSIVLFCPEVSSWATRTVSTRDVEKIEKGDENDERDEGREGS